MAQNDTSPDIAETLRRALNVELWSVSDYHRGLLAFVQETHDQRAATNARLAAVEKAIADLTERLEALQTKHEGLDFWSAKTAARMLGELDTSVSALTQRLDNHIAAASKKVLEIEQSLACHRDRLNGHDQRLDDQTELRRGIDQRLDDLTQREALEGAKETPKAPSDQPEPPEGFVWWPSEDNKSRRAYASENFHRLPTEDVNELRAYIHEDGKYKIQPYHTNDSLRWEIFYKNTDPQNIITWHFWGYYSSFNVAIYVVQKLAEEHWNSDNYFIRLSDGLYGWQTKDKNWIIYKNDGVWVVECRKVNLRESYNSLPEAAKFVRDNSLVWEENPSMNHGNRKAWKAENITVSPSAEPTEFFIVDENKSYHAEYFKYTPEGQTAAWNYAQTLTKKYVPEIPKD